MSKKKPTTRTTYRRIPKAKGPTQADKADRHILYERAVQCVESEIDMVDETYETLRGRKA
ncbi:MAG TPA: class I SAM-dependent methyltransferase, partial [Gammaproteobacteria bacterium]|nr:class I SAM-dependent methyltransferase [Gammaproteobacteria bacterium]